MGDSLLDPLYRDPMDVVMSGHEWLRVIGVINPELDTENQCRMRLQEHIATGVLEPAERCKSRRLREHTNGKVRGCKCQE